MSTRSMTIGALLAVLLAALPARGLPNEAKPFARLTLRESEADVLKTYPKMRKLDREQYGAAVVYSPFIDRYYQSGIDLAGLAHPVALELRFWKQQLWVVILYPGDNSFADMVAWVAKTYGPPHSLRPNPSWTGAKMDIAANTKGRWLSVNDRGLSLTIQKLLMEEMHMRLIPTPTPPAKKPG